MNPPDEPVKLRREDVWNGLVAKAENPLPFVSAITSCTILERTEDALVREVELRGERGVRERVTFHPPSRVEFERISGSVLGRILNQIEELPDGGLQLRFTLSLSVRGMEPGGEDERRYVERNRESYLAAVTTTLDAMRRAVARGRPIESPV